MEDRRRVVCPENQALEDYIWTIWQSMAQSTKPLSEYSDKAIQKAYLNVCSSKTPIVTLNDFSIVKGVGKWILKLMQGFFADNDDAPVDTDLVQKGKKLKGSRQYIPQKNSVAYALLITLYRGTMDGCEYMRKQELINAAEASGLSRVPVAPEKGKGKLGQVGSSAREWYSGWSCMTTLITKGLAVKSSCPAKYLLTDEGRRAAEECLLRSNLNDSASKSDIRPRTSISEGVVVVDLENGSSHSDKEVEAPILHSRKRSRSALSSSPLECVGRNHQVQKSFSCSSKVIYGVMKVPPLKSWEKFEETYEVILILDNREKFARGLNSGKLIQNICKEFNMKIEVRCLPVGDAIWIARHRQISTEYVLDFIVERKEVDDFRQSITDNRYRDQKRRLLRCGLKKLLYMVEGDPNVLGAAGSIKTACFTTEIDFDVQRTSGMGETLRRYGYITKKIENIFHLLLSEDRCENQQACMTYKEFTRRCDSLDKMSVSDVFATQLMQIPQVSEEMAIAVLDVYPTLLSLARAYALLDGDEQAQEELLKKQTNNVVNGSASRNIYQLVWGT